LPTLQGKGPSWCLKGRAFLPGFLSLLVHSRPLVAL
jgi:hypothetical protein